MATYQDNRITIGNFNGERHNASVMAFRIDENDLVILDLIMNPTPFIIVLTKLENIIALSNFLHLRSTKFVLIMKHIII